MKVANFKEIAIKNDQFRLSLRGCKVLLTQGVAHSQFQDVIIRAVQSFTDFTKDNDPYGEHDFGSFDVHGTRYFFKFDYYDNDYRYFQEDGSRVLTIGRMDEY